MAFSIVKEKLEKLQQRLLKLATSNQLLNTNFQSRGLDRFRIIDELPDQLYSSLVNDKTMKFDPLPQLDDDPRDEQKPKFKKMNLRIGGGYGDDDNEEEKKTEKD